MDNETTTSSKAGKSNLLPISIIIAAVLISGSIIYSNGKKTGGAGTPDDGPKVVKVSEDDDAVLGSKDAKVTLVEFSDFQCPYCRKFWREVVNNADFKKDYIDTGKVKLIYRDFPLDPRLHPMALTSALASECAHEQGKYWEYHDKMFEEQDKKGENTIAYTADDLKVWAKEIGLEAAKFNQCLDDKKYMAEVQKDLNDGAAAGVDGTPVTFINGRPLVGAQPWTLFKSILDSLL